MVAGRLASLLVECELGDGLALERVAVRGSQVAGVGRVAILRGQRRAGVRRRDRGHARRRSASGCRRRSRPSRPSRRGATMGLSAASFWAAVAPPSGVHRPSSVVRRMSWSSSLPPLSSIAISTPRSQSEPRVESAPERTPQKAMWIGSPAAISIVPRSSAGARDSPPAAAEAAAQRRLAQRRLATPHRRPTGSAARRAGPQYEERGYAERSHSNKTLQSYLLLVIRPVQTRGRSDRMQSGPSPCAYPVGHRVRPLRVPRLRSPPGPRSRLPGMLLDRRPSPSPGRRAGGRRSDAVSYPSANRMQHRSAAPSTVVELPARRSWSSWPWLDEQRLLPQFDCRPV